VQAFHIKSMKAPQGVQGARLAYGRFCESTWGRGENLACFSRRGGGAIIMQFGVGYILLLHKYFLAELAKQSNFLKISKKI
jgi:hypothetical protein